MKKQSNKIRIGVLGSANIATRSVIPAIKALPDVFMLYGLATRSIEKSSLNDDYRLVEGYENLIDKEFVDAIYIPLPNSLHFQWVKQALDKGIHVLVEKSLACSHSEVIELNNIAENKDLALVENFQFRFHPQLKYILELLSNKAIGELRYLRSSFCFPPFPDKNNIRYKKELGGGALLDAAAYPVKISQIILGKEIVVADASLNSNNGFEVDIWGGATLKQSKGNLRSQINFGFDNYYQCNVEILGSEGRIYTNRIFTAGENVTPSIILETKENGVKNIELKPANHFINMLEYFREVIGSEKLRQQEYLENINQSCLLQEIKQKANE
ncbi:Gfo/Idh/MocA family protein [Christiangramia sabulilitoris]|uniref:Gfo/Idh/MocA family oxidoreductase n=1 Tax=Christiangramia sabulilitoris TaxID=2583991 RepID=A0A550I2C2_9FLAO|nr:Gfo/Idh/MocA family oxidoreductase [Christiangramia sabulilitoris]TRO65117.1 Gfo/Idh/MocA family oxidoreductase [Christiangramia sabulilitoris]